MKKIIGVSSILFILDQLIKIIVVNHMKLNSSVEVIKNFFNITYVQNTGAAFSLFEGSKIFLIITAVLAIYLIYYIMVKDKQLNQTNIITISLLLGGIVANMFDRIIRGYVIDYLEFTIFNYHFPIFNFADICIVIGCLFLIIISIKEDNDGNKNKS
jgi:signal peptidase II